MVIHNDSYVHVRLRRLLSILDGLTQPHGKSICASFVSTDVHSADDFFAFLLCSLEVLVMYLRSLHRLCKQEEWDCERD